MEDGGDRLKMWKELEDVDERCRRSYMRKMEDVGGMLVLLR